MRTHLLLVAYRDLMPEWLFSHYERLALDGVYRHDWHMYVMHDLTHDRWIVCPTWKAQRKVMVAYEPNCRKCGEHNQRALEVDHIDYAYMGIELLYPESWQVLCDRCHRLVTTARKLQPALPMYDANEAAAMLFAAHAEKVDRGMNGRR